MLYTEGKYQNIKILILNFLWHCEALVTKEHSSGYRSSSRSPIRTGPMDQYSTSSSTVPRTVRSPKNIGKTVRK